jgi:PAS domain S-box-containing protein
MKKDMLQIIYTAMDNAQEGITISDATQPDNPLIYVNEGFLKMCGYSKEEIVGKNCRFLQVVETDRSTVDNIRNAIQKREPIQVDLLIIIKTVSPFGIHYL